MVPAESTDRLIIKGWPLRSERKEAHMEMIVAAVIALIEVGVAVALYLARRDPLTRDLNLGGAGLFILGRTSLRPRRNDKGKTDAE
jgi:hypothetical protein